MICGRPVPVRLLSRCLILAPRSHFLQPQKTFCQKSDKDCGPPKPKPVCISYKKDPCAESACEAPKLPKDSCPMSCKTRLDRKRRFLAEKQKKKEMAECKEAKETNYCAKKEPQASKKDACGKPSKTDSCGQKEPKASKESACSKPEPKASKESCGKASKEDSCGKASKEDSCDKASKEDSCGKASKEDSCGKTEDPCVIYKKFLAGEKGKKGKNSQQETCETAVTEQSQGPTCETEEALQPQKQQPKSLIAERAPPSSNRIRRPANWNVMQSLLNCMLTGMKVANITHQQRKILTQLLAARNKRLDDEEATQNIKCADGAAPKKILRDADARAKKFPETVKQGKTVQDDHEE